MNYLRLLFPVALGLSCHVEAGWFPDSPLQKTYLALAEHQPNLAWQELQIALGEQQLDPRYWHAAKQAILTQTRCGKALRAEPVHVASGVSVSFIRRSGVASQGYQIKLTADSVPFSLPVELVAPSGESLLAGQLAPSAEYQEIETSEMLTPPPFGFYQLKLGTNRYPLVVSVDDSQPWLSVNVQTHTLSLSLPETVAGCADPVANWLWLDEQYDMVKLSNVITSTQTSLPGTGQTPFTARHLSAVATQFEYQHSVKVEYVQRIAIPLPQEP
ncbi:DUF2861 family protein [Vibrio fluvialis]|nr:DUF2861 family protein [Vibrio fluvialis]